MISQGARANKSGKELERNVESILNALGIPFLAQVKFTNCYGNPGSKMDFYLPTLDVAVECKYQNTAGTADQKLPFVLEDLALFPASHGLIILDGKHYLESPYIQYYLNRKLSPTFSWVFLHNFGAWLIEQTNSRKAP